ncbi:hypothetical protein [Catenuloplanes indicus]|uniref:Uncharacterized protein n=1 Tax=Catenuloplanes indicus TaxID=137267 RepID=A0AAE3W8I0_9ACTN|nr:hypothetical protein [Catenuloplanes indicus]MDQ0371586.1 hypothetical protein [Catenuloplanes indicus]
MTEEELNARFAALADDASGPDPALVGAVTLEVNRCQPWWRRVGTERVASLVGAVQFVRATGSLNPADPAAIAAVVKASGLRGRRVHQLAWKVTTTILAIEEWESRVR